MSENHLGNISLSLRPSAQPLSLLNTAQLASWLGISTRTVCLWAECAHLPAVKVGRQWRFHREAIEEWLADRAPLDKKITAVAASAAYTLCRPPV